MPDKYDLVVIGGGPGGYVAAIRAAQLGMKAACVERERPGGICLNWGCIPTKALLRSAEVFALVQHAQDYGILVDNPRFDFEKIISRSRAVADKLASGVEFLFRKHKIELIRGHATLAGRGRVEVRPDKGGSPKHVEASRIIIATGARARGLPGIEPDGEHILTYREAMILRRRPSSLVVIGAGAIGVEFASFYRALGTEVTLVEALPRLLPIEDEEISQALERAFKKRGIVIKTGVKVKGAKLGSGKVTIELEGESLTADKVLLSTGVRPNTDGIGLEAMGVKLDPRGFVEIDSDYKTSSPGIYALGDCAGRQLLAHKAMQEGVVCVETMAGKRSHSVDYSAIPSCTYSSPEVASVGMTEKAAREAGHEVKVGRFPFSALGKALVIGESEGMVKAVLDAKHGEILGVHMIGPHVTDLVIEPTLARTAELTLHELGATMHAHPTLAEGVQEAILNAVGEAIHI